MDSCSTAKNETHHTFGDILYLHCIINQTKSKMIQKFLLELKPRMLKHLLLIYLQYFFDAEHRDAYLVNNNSSSSNKLQMHCKIIKLIILKLQCQTVSICKKPRLQQLQFMSHLSMTLLSDCIACLSQKDRVATSRVNSQWFRASSVSQARHHLKINSKFMRTQLIRSPQQFEFGHVGTLDVGNANQLRLTTDAVVGRCKQKKYKKKIANYRRNLVNLLSNDTLKTFKGVIRDQGTAAALSQLPLAQNIDHWAVSNLDKSGKCFPPRQLLASAKHISVSDDFCAWKNAHLWMNDARHEMFCITLKEIDIEHYILDNASLHFLDLSLSKRFCLHDSNSFMCHPLYLLWNLRNLRQCKLNVTLPIADEFEVDCVELLACKSVTKRCRKQTGFEELYINVAVVDDVQKTHRGSVTNVEGLRVGTHNQYLHRDYAVFLRYVLRLYPHLKSIKCDFLRYQSYQLQRFLGGSKLRKSQRLFDVQNICFDHLVHINLSIPTVTDAISFLGHVKHDNLQTLALYILIADLKRTDCTGETIRSGDGDGGGDGDGDEEDEEDDEDNRFGFVTGSIHAFVEVVCTYLSGHVHHLHSFIIDIDNRFAVHRSLRHTYWSVYHKYLCHVETLIASNRIYDGYLQFNVPTMIQRLYNEQYYRRCYRQRKTFQFYDAYVWRKQNIQQSLEVEKVIANIQCLMSAYNQSIKYDAEQNEKKLILFLPTLTLHKEHNQFLKFWFRGNDSVFETPHGHCNNGCKFVFC